MYCIVLIPLSAFLDSRPTERGQLIHTTATRQMTIHFWNLRAREMSPYFTSGTVQQQIWYNTLTSGWAKELQNYFRLVWRFRRSSKRPFPPTLILILANFRSLCTTTGAESIRCQNRTQSKKKKKKKKKQKKKKKKEIPPNFFNQLCLPCLATNSGLKWKWSWDNTPYLDSLHLIRWLNTGDNENDRDDNSRSTCRPATDRKWNHCAQCPGLACRHANRLLLGRLVRQAVCNTHGIFAQTPPVNGVHTPSAVVKRYRVVSNSRF